MKTGKLSIKMLLMALVIFTGSIQAQQSKAAASKSVAEDQKTILVVTGVPNPSEQEALAYYSEQVKPLFAEAGGKVISKYKVKEKLHGHEPAALVFIAEFPSEAAVKGFFNSKEYKAILPYRNKGFTSLNIYIAN